MNKRTDGAMRTLAEAYGGMKNFHTELEQRRNALQKMWSVDPIQKGRVIKAHLFVEHYLNLYLSKVLHYRRDRIDKMGFWDKASILTKEAGPGFKKLNGPLSRFNRCRNNLAHNLEKTLTDGDKRFIESIDDPRFASWLLMFKTELESVTAVELYELFATFMAQVIDELLNPRQHLLDNVMSALREDVLEIYFGDDEAK